MVKVKILDQDEKFFISKMIVHANENRRCKVHFICYGKDANNKISTQFYGLGEKEYNIMKEVE